MSHSDGPCVGLLCVLCTVPLAALLAVRCAAPFAGVLRAVGIVSQVYHSCTHTRFVYTCFSRIDTENPVNPQNKNKTKRGCDDGKKCFTSPGIQLLTLARPVRPIR